MSTRLSSIVALPQAPWSIAIPAWNAGFDAAWCGSAVPVAMTLFSMWRVGSGFGV